MAGILHVLFSPRAEGCPRLALELLKQEKMQRKRVGAVAFCVNDPPDLLPQFEELGATPILLDWQRRRYFQFLRNAHSLLRRTRPTGIICYTVGMHVLIGIAAWTLRIPVVLHLGNAPPLNQPDALRKIRFQMTLGKHFTTAYAACSDYVRSTSISSYGLSSERVITIQNGIDLARFFAIRIKSSAKVGAAPIEIGMVANLEETKNHRLLIEAFALLRSRGQSARLTIIGGGTLAPELKQLSQTLGVEHYVRWTGPVSDVAVALAQLDVFAFCTTPSEGMGIALVEALAAGIPVVASNVGACREVLQHTRSGRLVGEESPESWADALCEIGSIRVPEASALVAYDISETFRAYARSLGIEG